VRLGRPLVGVPGLFLAAILISGLLGELVARFYSEPMNRLLRRRWREGPEFLGSVIEDRESRPAVKEIAR
jgi:peptidoglycan/LPS O-acetylase OafA/YrhL